MSRHRDSIRTARSVVVKIGTTALTTPSGMFDASRLEGLTRRFSDYPILISGELRDLLGDAVDAVDLGAQMVKGWPDPVQVFALTELRA